MLIFGEEDQGGFFWSLLWTLDGLEADPTVWFLEYDEPPIAEQEPLSGFLIQFSLYEAAMGADYNSFSAWAGATHLGALGRYRGRVDPVRRLTSRSRTDAFARGHRQGAVNAA
ncbi:hypothetical protein GCM10011579_097460 [Streptomyces albiflavescens]|uniref:Uncharacterized protein n=1 Tax=Streptomyces albiflavescens TaxID=1623582 RepID=A0A918DAM3_9ACTN|nr:hypothetical protein [Streptomyces albiflavescens]GGN96231.1 hypothetical protein GCM10011579_097460 [Streptomyces albiflavescens]